MSEQPDKDPGPIPSEEQWARRAVQDDGLPTVEALAALERLDRFVERVRTGWSVAGAIGLEDDQFMRDIVVILAALRAAPPLHDPTPELPDPMVDTLP